MAPLVSFSCRLERPATVSVAKDRLTFSVTFWTLTASKSGAGQKPKDSLPQRSRSQTLISLRLGLINAGNPKLERKVPHSDVYSISLTFKVLQAAFQGVEFRRHNKAAMHSWKIRLRRVESDDI